MATGASEMNDNWRMIRAAVIMAERVLRSYEESPGGLTDTKEAISGLKSVLRSQA
jgi:hypothetical protein